MLGYLIGLAAAVCTTVAYFPQLKKSWQTRRTDDLSLTMLLVLSSGVALWVVYGVIKADWVIIAANSVALTCLGVLTYFKLSGLRRSS
jgi:MtN3 and saliva related transmembrane protein